MDKDVEKAKRMVAQYLMKEQEKLNRHKVMKALFTFIVSYDIKNDDEDKVRGSFRDALVRVCKASMLSESTYAFSNTDEVPIVKSKIVELYLKAYKDNCKEIDKKDKVWLICADKKADSHTQNPYEMACYELVSEQIQR